VGGMEERIGSSRDSGSEEWGEKGKECGGARREVYYQPPVDEIMERESGISSTRTLLPRG